MFLSSLIYWLHVRTVVSRRWVRCLLARPACESMRCSVFMGLLGHRIAALGSEPYARGERTWVTTFEYSLHEFALLFPAGAPETMAAKKNTSRPPQFPRTMAAS